MCIHLRGANENFRSKSARPRLSYFGITTNENRERFIIASSLFFYIITLRLKTCGFPLLIFSFVTAVFNARRMIYASRIENDAFCSNYARLRTSQFGITAKKAEVSNAPPPFLKSVLHIIQLWKATALPIIFIELSSSLI